VASAGEGAVVGNQQVMGTFMTCLACAGAAVVIAGILLSIGWLILAGGLVLLIGALAVPSARLPR
jgi:hypothetical protein